MVNTNVEQQWRSQRHALLICLACWRERFSMTDDPPQIPYEQRRMRTCVMCGRPTNHGITINANMVGS